MTDEDGEGEAPPSLTPGVVSEPPWAAGLRDDVTATFQAFVDEGAERRHKAAVDLELAGMDYDRDDPWD